LADTPVPPFDLSLSLSLPSSQLSLSFGTSPLLPHHPQIDINIRINHLLDSIAVVLVVFHSFDTWITRKMIDGSIHIEVYRERSSSALVCAAHLLLLAT
jgi:hypothetical protein